MSKHKYPDDEQIEVGRRLRLVREELDIQSQEMGGALNEAANTYSQWENGTHMFPLYAALRLYERFRVSLDWIYRGDPSSLPMRFLPMVNRAVSGAPTPKRR